MPEDKKSSTVDFLNNIAPEPFKEEQVETPEEEKEEVAGEEKVLPFHKDPKVQRYVEKQIEKALKDVKPSAEQKFKQEVREELNLPPALVKFVGNDTPEKREVLKELASYLDSLPVKAQEQFEAKMLKDTQEAAAKDSAALEELNTGFEAIEEEYGVDLTSDTKTRASFIEFLRKVSHKNAEGEVDQFADIPSAWETFQERQKPVPASRAKELASRGMTRSGDANTAPKAGNSWRDVDKYFESLKKTVN